MKYKGVIFDLDGTILDTISDLGNSVNNTLEKYGQPLHSYEEYKKKGVEKPKEDNMGPEQWKIDNLKYLHDNKMVDQFDGWLKKIDDNMPAWAVLSILANMHKVLTEKK